MQSEIASKNFYLLSDNFVFPQNSSTFSCYGVRQFMNIIFSLVIELLDKHTLSFQKCVGCEVLELEGLIFKIFS
jgi:hypothetical protein